MAERHSKLCSVCGKVFYGYASHIKKVKTCSVACSIVKRKELAIKNYPNTFWRNVDILSNNSCWNWKASKNDKGYGMVKYLSKLTGAHRVAYILTNGEIPDGMEIMHSCDNRACCNPTHLSAGTHLDNLKDMYKKNRNYSKLTKEQVKNVKTLLDSNKTTQREIAKGLNVHFSTISAIANNRIWHKDNAKY